MDERDKRRGFTAVFYPANYGLVQKTGVKNMKKADMQKWVKKGRDSAQKGG